MTERLINRLRTPTGPGDMYLTTLVDADETDWVVSGVPANALTPNYRLRADDEFVMVTAVALPHITVVRQCEDATLFPKTPHSANTPLYLVLTEGSLTTAIVEGFGGLSDNYPEVVDADDPDPGVGTAAARDDHKHDISTDAPGDSAVGDVADEGISTSLALADHVHGREAFGSPTGLADANAAGSASTVPHSDHVHKRTVRVKKAGTDVGTRNALNLIEGTGIGLTVADNAGADRVDITVAVTSVPPTDLDDLADVNAPSPTDGQVLTWDDGAGEWVAADPTGGGGGGSGGSGGVVGTATFNGSGGISGATYEGIISSVARLGTGHYQVNLTPSQTAPYAVSFAVGDDNTTAMAAYIAGTAGALGASSFEFYTFDLAGVTQRDSETITVTVMQLSPHIPAYLLYQEQQASGVGAGTFSNGAWRTRLLNTEVSDDDGHGSIAANQITLDAGTYELSGWAMAHNVGQNKLRWQNITDSTTAIEGGSHYASSTNDGEVAALIEGRFTIAGTKTFELQHQCQVTHASDGFGTQGGFGTEIYSSIKLIKVA